MEDTLLLSKVKEGLSVGGTYNDAQLKTKTLAVKQYILNAGVTDTRLNSDLGTALITIGVTDIWNLSSGDVKFSDAFKIIIAQMKALSMADAEVITSV